MAAPEPDTYSIEQAAESFDVSADDVRAYIEEGLLRPDAEGETGPALSRGNMRRLWSIVTLHRDLGINLAGVAAVLRLREQFEQVRRDLATLLEIVERELGPDVWDRLWPEGRPTPHANVSVEGFAEGAEPPPAAGPAGEPADEDTDAPGSAGETPPERGPNP